MKQESFPHMGVYSRFPATLMITVLSAVPFLLAAWWVAR